MIIPIPIFIKPKSEEVLKIERNYQKHMDLLELKRNFRKDLQEFKQRFRNQDPRVNPEAAALLQGFGHTDIEKLNLIDLMGLGFDSNHIILEMFQ